MVTVQARHYEFALAWNDERFQATLQPSQEQDGIILLQIKITASEAATPPEFTLSWTHSIVDIHSIWTTRADRTKSLLPDWIGRPEAKATSQAPVSCLHSFNGQNRLTFALSDALNTVKYGAGVHEETATFRCVITLFAEPLPPINSYEATVRLDTRDIPYYQALHDVQQWWAQQPGYTPSPVPESARQPMYSTWYSFHQQVFADKVEEQCLLAKSLGCEAVIVDDGWQTSDNSRGYAYTGDWEVTPDKIPDMQAHVARIHAMGMKYILWYSVPFVGLRSKIYERFKDKMLYEMEGMGTGVLDPRYPEVREYIITLYEQAVREWDLDGFKLDFVDSFSSPFNKDPKTLYEGMDYLSVPAAVDRLLTDVMERLRLLKPDIMIEFRQTYIGPLMRKYGNMFRAGDCPNDSLTNRVRTIDIRLLCGDTAAHADMLMWHPQEPVESAALQIINILFSVPQISVLLNKLPEHHLAMTRYWLSFWRQHRDVLLDGALVPLHPESLYPLVLARNEQKLIAVLYQQGMVVSLPETLPDEIIIINGTRENWLYLELPAGETRNVTMLDCQGQPVVTPEHSSTGQGLYHLAVPAAGQVILHRQF